MIRTLRILFLLISCSLATTTLAFAIPTNEAEALLNPLFELAFYPVSCPNGNDGMVEITSVDEEITLSQLDWEITSDSPNLVVTLDDEKLIVSGVDYMNEHCIQFTVNEDPDFLEVLCFQNDQVLDPDLLGAPEIFHGGDFCSYNDTSVFLIDFDFLPYENITESLDITLINNEDGEEIIPFEIVHVSLFNVIVYLSPWYEDMTVSWEVNSSGCSWSQLVQSAPEHILPDEIIVETIDEGLDGTTLLLSLPDETESWDATFNGSPFSTFPQEVFVETGAEATLEICHIASEYCCRTWELDYEAYEPVYGCTDESSCTYNPDASEDDGSCLYDVDCGDIDGDGFTDTDDLLLLLSNFGLSGVSLDGDFNGDQVVNTIDLLQFLVLFG